MMCERTIMRFDRKNVQYYVESYYKSDRPGNEVKHCGSTIISKKTLIQN